MPYVTSSVAIASRRSRIRCVSPWVTAGGSAGVCGSEPTGTVVVVDWAGGSDVVVRCVVLGGVVLGGAVVVVPLAGRLSRHPRMPATANVATTTVRNAARPCPRRRCLAIAARLRIALGVLE